MRYLFARFVSGALAILFLALAVALFVRDIGNYHWMFREDFARYMVRDTIALAFSIYCAIRFVIWTKRARNRDRTG